MISPNSSATTFYAESFPRRQYNKGIKKGAQGVVLTQEIEGQAAVFSLGESGARFA
jgi:hypothetical protein